MSDEDDRIERLGRRIGRILSLVLAAALIVYLWHTYLSR
jgi:hypothetical protein